MLTTYTYESKTQTAVRVYYYYYYYSDFTALKSAEGIPELNTGSRRKRKGEGSEKHELQGQMMCQCMDY